MFGAPYQLTKIDSDEDRGALILDLETLDDYYINNTTSIKYKSIIYPTTFNDSDIFNNIITVFIKENDSLDKLKVDSYLKEIDKFKPINIKIELIKNENKIIDLKQNLPDIKIEELFKNYLKNSKYDNIDKLYGLLMQEYNLLKN